MTKYLPSGSVDGPVISTSVSKSGGSSLYWPNNCRGNMSIDISNPGSDAGANSYTIEAWVKGARNAYTGSGAITGIAAFKYGTSSDGNGLYVYGSSNEIRVRHSYSGVSPTPYYYGAIGDDWQHIAEVGCGRVGRLFVNGQLSGLVASSLTTCNFNQGGKFFLGYTNAVTPTYTMSGWTQWCPTVGGYVDMVRVTSFPRYWHNFTPPASPFGTSRLGDGVTSLVYTASQNYTGSGHVLASYSSLTDSDWNTGGRTRTPTGGGTAWFAMDLGSPQWVHGIKIGPPRGTIGGSTCTNITDSNAIVEFSNDNANWANVCSLVSSTMFGGGLATSGHTHYGMHVPFPQPIFAQYFRLKFSAASTTFFQVNSLGVYRLG